MFSLWERESLPAVCNPSLPANGTDENTSLRDQPRRRLRSPPPPSSSRSMIPPVPPLPSRPLTSSPPPPPLSSKIPLVPHLPLLSLNSSSQSRPLRGILKHSVVVGRPINGESSSNGWDHLKVPQKRLCRGRTSLATDMSDIIGLISELSKGIREAQHSRDHTRAQSLINSFDQAIVESEACHSLATLRYALQELRRWCRTSQILPHSCNITHNIQLDSQHAISYSATSDIYRGTCDGLTVAVKSLRIHMDNVDVVKKSFRCEAITWKYLRHEHIVPFLGIGNIFGVCLVSEWMAEGSINQFLKRHPEADRLSHIRDILSGLDYMHQLGVIHGDLKSANVLVDHDHRARLADFGLTKVLYNTTTAATTLAGGGLGTVRWMAPELCEMDDGHGSNQATVRSDIYALTITIWELFTLEKPFLSITRDIAVPRYVCAGHRPYKPRGCERIGFSEELWIVMQSGWSSYPSARPPLSAFSAVLARSS